MSRRARLGNSRGAGGDDRPSRSLHYLCGCAHEVWQVLAPATSECHRVTLLIGGPGLAWWFEGR